MSEELAGRVVLVTGGASGIGRASAVRMGLAGARVVIADLDGIEGEATAALVRDSGGEACFVPVDVTDARSVAEMMDAALDTYGRLDCAHNNAGILGPVGDMHECSLDDYLRVVAVNQTGVWQCMHAEVTHMLARGEPPEGGYSIVNTASVAGLVGSPLLAAYTASKHAVVGMTRAAARCYGRRGIRVNCVCPGPIDTPLAQDLLDHPGAREKMRERQALERLAEPEEVATLVAWLCSAQASMVTGTPVRVDGGALA